VVSGAVLLFSPTHQQTSILHILTQVFHLYHNQTNVSTESQQRGAQFDTPFFDTPFFDTPFRNVIQ